MKTLVLYYSRTGTTAELAARIAAAAGCESVAIEEEKSRRGVLGFMRSGKEALLKKTVPVKLPDIDFSVYDLVIVGSPIWAGTLSSPARSFLAEKASSIKALGAFSTASEVKDFEHVFKEFLPVKAYLHLSTKQVRKEDCSQQINTFLQSLETVSGQDA